MKRAPLVSLLVAGAAGLVLGSFYAGLHWRSPGEATTGAAQRPVLYWHDPMVPGQRFDKPGQSPFMDMPLVPVYADDAGSKTGVSVSAAMQQNLGMRMATVQRADVSSSFDAVGVVQFDERLNVAVQSRVAGYVERLAVRAPMEAVRQGQVLATLFAPEWLGPQNELIALQQAGVSQALVNAARERLRALSIPDALVRQSEDSGIAQARFEIHAPASGVVAELGVREGMAVTPGTTLFRIAGLEKVWAVAEVPEAQAVRLWRGQQVKAVLQADERQSFGGALEEILPQVNASTRTLQARFEVQNRGGRLIPGMLLRLQVTGPARTRLLVPAEALIRTGQRVVVIVRQDSGNDDGAFEPRDVQVGADLGEQVEVVSGLAEGEQVVASGQFLIDSEARLRSVLDAMAPASTPTAAHAVHAGEGQVESMDAGGLTISHGPITALKWPAMTMGFGKPDAKAFADIRPGDTVRFTFKAGGPLGYELVSVQRSGAAR